MNGIQTTLAIPVTMSGFVNFCLYAIHAPTQEQHESLEESL